MISVLLPTYNQAAFLPDALQSINGQTYRDFELIACDDGSTDTTGLILKDAGIRTITHETNKGSAAAINSAASQARGDYWTWVSSDNTMDAKWLKTLVAEMDDSTGVVYSGFWYETLHTQRPMFRDYNPATLINDKNCFFGPSFLIRADVWRAAGPHAGGISHDYGHWLRVEETCWRMGLGIKGISTPLCHYRAHPDRAGVKLKHLYDAPKHQAEARARRLCA